MLVANQVAQILRTHEPVVPRTHREPAHEEGREVVTRAVAEVKIRPARPPRRDPPACRFFEHRPVRQPEVVAKRGLQRVERHRVKLRAEIPVMRALRTNAVRPPMLGNARSQLQAIAQHFRATLRMFVGDRERRDRMRAVNHLTPVVVRKIVRLAVFVIKPVEPASQNRLLDAAPRFLRQIFVEPVITQRDSLDSGTLRQTLPPPFFARFAQIRLIAQEQHFAFGLFEIFPVAVEPKQQRRRRDPLHPAVPDFPRRRIFAECIWFGKLRVQFAQIGLKFARPFGGLKLRANRVKTRIGQDQTRMIRLELVQQLLRREFDLRGSREGAGNPDECDERGDTAR